MKQANLKLFLSLYALQGLIVAYLFNFNKNYMIRCGVSLPDASLVETVALLPLAFKFLAGPVSDKYNLLGFGHRRPYIALGLLAQSAGLVGLALVDPGANLHLFGAMAVLAVLGLSINDTCCDGMVIDVTEPADRAKVQGWLWTSRFIAATLGTLAFGFWLRDTGLLLAPRALWACALFGLAPFVLNLFAREPSTRDPSENFRWSALKVMIEPRSVALLAFGIIYGMVSMGVEINLSVFYTRMTPPILDIGELGAIRNFGRVAGALLMPLAWVKLSRANVLGCGILLLSVSIVGQSIVTGRGSADAWTFLFGVANGWCDALFATLAMESSSRVLAASTFALFMAVTNLSVVGNLLFANSVVLNGFPLTFQAAGLITLLSLIPAWFLRKPPSSFFRDASNVA